MALFVSKELVVARRPDLEVPDIELLWTEIRVHNNKFLLGTVYRPPNAPVSFWDKLQDSTDLAKISNIQNIILTGDLNSDFNTTAGSKLKQFCSINLLTPHITEPTRITATTATCLDQIISNIPAFVKEPRVLPPICNCDHSVVASNILFRRKKDSSYNRFIWEYKKADFDLFRESLTQADWDNCFTSENVDLCCDNWTKLFIHVAKETIPGKSITVRPLDLPWFNSSLRCTRRKVHRAYNKAKDHKYDVHFWNSYTTIRNQYQEQLKTAETNYNNKLGVSLKNATKKNKAWWRTVKYFLNRNQSSAIPSLFHDNCHITDNLSKAEIFNKFFLDQSNIDTSRARAPPALNQPEVFLGSIRINREEVLDILKSLDVTKATGPDGVSAILLREGAPSICDSLTRLFNLSLQQEVFPSSWKQAHVTPLHKKGDTNLCNNYRPISLLSCVGKVMEKVVFKYVFNFFRENLLLSSNQSGFMPGDSTVNQLLCLYHELSLAVDLQKEVRVVFLDISKAFDRVWHHGLLYKLERSGISQSLLQWFKNYLSNRQQRVVINGKTSTWGTINAGVPQGSVLGPLLFLIFINDIVDIVHSKIKLFADDTSLYLTVDNPQLSADILNGDLSSIDSWSSDWMVTFNALKTDAMLVSRKRNQVFHPPLSFQNHQLDNVEQHKHLGIILRSDLRWKDHIDLIIVRASKQLNIMKSLQYLLDRETLEVIYKSFIRPLMEYGSVVWDGCTQGDSQRLESVQLAAARVISGAMLTTPNDKLYEETGLQTLAKRREINKLIQMYKITHNLAPEYLREIIFSNQNQTRRNTRQAENLPHFRARTDLFDNTFFPCTTRLWNQLPLNIRNCNSLNEFKKYIDSKVPRSIKETKLYYVGNRYPAVIQARFRMGRSQLNAHLHAIGLCQSPNCRCGLGTEDAWHYFFVCPLYIIPRDRLHTSISYFAPFTLETILFGSQNCSFEENKIIFLSVQEYIIKTKRFQRDAIT